MPYEVAEVAYIELNNNIMMFLSCVRPRIRGKNVGKYVTSNVEQMCITIIEEPNIAE
jgi:hypothetical protein